ncbi:CHAT domain-containing protein [Suillus bovinus]|uniref:CHAT domain-containing protein n=1 Tax=Suillus bovinus TaxID=48563 RepID=UPI001B874F0F|nr:CHAT domain-containing protein [Suillus bovinus]KAG2153737.1 CHAT domain-containing protein [Suillus bovinus]
MPRRRRVTFESPSSSKSADFSPASSSPNPQVEIYAPSIEPLKGRKHKRKSSGNVSDQKTKSSESSRSQKKDNEESSYLEHAQDPGETQPSRAQQVVITTVRATDPTLGLRQIPTGTHAVVKADGVEYQTSNKPHLDFDIPISLFQDVIDLPPTGHPDRPITQFHLAIALLSSLIQMDDHVTEDLPSEVLDVCHINSHVYGSALIAIESFALHSTGSTYDLRKERLATSILPLSSNQLTHRVERCLEGDESRALDEMISLLYDVLGYYTAEHAGRGRLLGNLALKLQTRFERRGNNKDLDQAIAVQMEMLFLCPVGHADRSGALNNLATQLSARFDHQGNDKDLDQAIAFQREALALRPVDHLDRFMSLNNLATQLSTRFQHRGNDKDLDQSIAIQREALTLQLVGHTDRSGALNNLANRIFNRFEHRGDDEDLDQAIALLREALALQPVGHLDRFLSLNNLATQLSTRFDHRGNDNDLDQSIALQREALALQPVGHIYRSTSLNNLANRISTRFDHRGNDEDLDQSISLYREALALRPVGHTGRPSSLNDLAVRLSIRFDHRGNDEDLDQAIALHREALALTSVGHTDRPTQLNNLATQLFIRFHQRCNDNSDGDLDQAAALYREALALHPHRGDDKDLDQAIALQTEVLDLCPVGHIDRSSSLNNLANQLSFRFSHRGNDEDLDRAIILHKEALALRPVGHPDRFGSSNNLAAQLCSRFKHRGNREDLDESRETLRCGLTLLTQHDARLLGLTALARVMIRTVSMLPCIISRQQQTVVSGGLLSRMRASLLWSRHADEALDMVVDWRLMRLPCNFSTLICPRQLQVSSRHRAMAELLTYTCRGMLHRVLFVAVMCLAPVELLEQGRTIIWTQMTRLHTPLDKLQTRGSHAAALVKKFRGLSSLLDKPPADYPEATQRVNVEREETRYRRLVEEWNGTVEEIRKIEGFSRFLLPPLFSDLQDAARDGPIVVLIASRSSCHAIIIPHKRPPTSIQLLTDWWKLAKLMIALREAVKKEASPKGNQSRLIKALRELWDDVVCPVVEHLDVFARRGSRIWWCPTSFFNFLPLHAAGEYRAKGKSLSQKYISSYTPSLTALIKARGIHERSPPVPFVAIGQNHPAGASFTLDAVEPELELVRGLLPPPPTVSFSKVTSVDATKSRALCALQDNTWLHLACHGTQKMDEPFKSAFLMRDQPLSLLDITQMNLSQHEFAFLSACETAVGTFSTPDEVIHLAGCSAIRWGSERRWDIMEGQR